MNNEIITPDDLDPSATMQIKIVELLKSVGRPMKPAMIAKELDENKGNVQSALGRMKAEGLVKQPRYGFYVLAKKSEAQNILNPLQEKPHTPESQSAIGLTPETLYHVSDKSQPQTEEGKVEAPMPGVGVSQIFVPEWIIVKAFKKPIFRIQISTVIPGEVHVVDITQGITGLILGYDNPEKEEGPPENG